MSAGCVVQFDTDSAIALPQVSRLPLQVFFSFTLRAGSLTRAFSHTVIRFCCCAGGSGGCCCMSASNEINLMSVCEAVNVCIFYIRYFRCVKTTFVHKRLSCITYIIIILWFYFTQTHTHIHVAPN